MMDSGPKKYVRCHWCGDDVDSEQVMDLAKLAGVNVRPFCNEVCTAKWIDNQDALEAAH